MRYVQWKMCEQISGKGWSKVGRRERRKIYTDRSGRKTDGLWGAIRVQLELRVIVVVTGNSVSVVIVFYLVSTLHLTR